MTTDKDKKSYFSGRGFVVMCLIACQIAVVQGNSLAGRIKGRILEDDYNPLVQTVVQQITYFLVWGIVFAIMRSRKAISDFEASYIFTLIKPARPGMSLWKRLGAWKYAIIQSIIELVSSYLGTIAQIKMNGIIFDIFRQATIIFAVFWSALLLKKRYTAYELAAISLLLAVTLIKVFVDRYVDQQNAIKSGKPQDDEALEFGPIMFMLVARILAGLGNVFVEYICDDYEDASNGKRLSNVSLTFFTVTWQFVVLPLVVPIFEVIRCQMVSMSMSDMFREAFSCFANIEFNAWDKKLQSNVIRNCKWGWQSMFAYMFFNLFLNLVINAIINFDGTVSLFMGFQIANIVGLATYSIPWFSGVKCPQDQNPVEELRKPLFKPADVHWTMAIFSPLIVLSFVVYRYGAGMQKAAKKDGYQVCCFPLRKQRAPMAHRKAHSDEVDTNHVTIEAEATDA